jgi:hypothetical protein
MEKKLDVPLLVKMMGRDYDNFFERGEEAEQARQDKAQDHANDEKI